MGLFSTTRKIYVDSLLYNLAGDEVDRSDFLKSVVVHKAILGGPGSYGQAIQQSLLNGSATRLKRYFNWTQKPENYGLIGVPTARHDGTVSLDAFSVAAHIPHGSDEQLRIQKLDFALADFSWWAEQWILANDQDLLDVEYEVDRDEVTGEILIVVDEVEQVRFSPTDFVPDALYIYAAFNRSSGMVAGDLVPGALITLGSGEGFPPFDGWKQVYSTSTRRNFQLNTHTTKTVTLSSGEPPVVTETERSRVESANDADSFYQLKEFRGLDDDAADSHWQVVSSRYMQTIWSVVPVESSTTLEETLEGGVIRTTVTVVIRDELQATRTHRTDTQESTIGSWGPVEIFLYRLGSGIPALDEMVRSEYADGNQYCPFIPCRIDNKSIRHASMSAAFVQAEKAYKKLTGGQDFNEILDKIEDNESIDDIDYTYITHGVPLNVEHQAGLRYLYQYFRGLLESQENAAARYQLWLQTVGAYNEKMDLWSEWKLAQLDVGHSLYGTPEPTQIVYPAQPTNSVRVSSVSSGLTSNYDMRMEWSSISEETGSGLLEPGRKKGTVWWEGTGGPDDEDADEVDVTIYTALRAIKTRFKADNKRLCWQETDTKWRRLTLTGLVHQNYIYKGKFVSTSLKTALEDPDESGFLVPLHFPTFRRLSLLDQTKIADECGFLVFNCYVVKKTKWYQKGIFRILVVIAIVVAAVLIAGPAGGGAAAGVLGTNAAVGAAIGLTGMLAVVAGAVANALAAMILVAIIQKASVAILGDKWGAIIGSIVATVAVMGATSFSTTGSFSSMWQTLSSAEGLIALTDSLGQGFAGLVQANAQGWMERTEKMMQDYEAKSDELSDLYATNIGYGNGQFDPNFLTDTFSIRIESPDSFLSRTLMCGSDIAEVTHHLLSEFGTLTLSSDLPIR